VARAYVGLGTNRGAREALLGQAVELLRERVEVRAVSSVRETEPWGLADQPPFLNAAVEVETELTPRELLDSLLEIEHQLGRTREGPQYGPRTIDLDLLVYEDETLEEPGLTVPHPRLHERRFALEPLFELAPDLVVPGRGPVRQLLGHYTEPR
jgi:2-amino-4-hydroxy-6-hydroxymethyldihydropteridine diphosphokinase